MSTNPIINEFGTQRWRNEDGKLHRTDGPAVIYADGAREWCVNGQFHREDGPAVIHADGTQYWIVNDKRHREDGPAIIYADGTQSWWVNSKRIRSIKEYQKATKLSDEDMTMLVLKYGNIE